MRHQGHRGEREDLSCSECECPAASAPAEGVDRQGERKKTLSCSQESNSATERKQLEGERRQLSP